jgi:hypothetical protein
MEEIEVRAESKGKKRPAEAQQVPTTVCGCGQQEYTERRGAG